MKGIQVWTPFGSSPSNVSYIFFLSLLRLFPLLRISTPTPHPSLISHSLCPLKCPYCEPLQIPFLSYLFTEFFFSPTISVVFVQLVLGTCHSLEVVLGFRAMRMRKTGPSLQGTRSITGDSVLFVLGQQMAVLKQEASPFHEAPLMSPYCTSQKGKAGME